VNVLSAEVRHRDADGLAADGELSGTCRRPLPSCSMKWPARYPDATPRADDGEISYGRVHERSNRLAVC